MASKEVGSYRENLAGAILGEENQSRALNLLLSVNVPLRDKFKVLDFPTILVNNSESLDSLERLTTSLAILEQCGKILLKPDEDRPETWRLIEHSSLTMKGGLHILKLMGYSELTPDEMAFLEGAQPDFMKTLDLVIDIVIARGEIEAYMNDCHPNPSGIKQNLLSQGELKQDNVHSVLYTRETTDNSENKPNKTRNSNGTPSGKEQKESDEMNIYFNRHVITTQTTTTEKRSSKGLMSCTATSEETIIDEVRQFLANHAEEFGSEELEKNIYITYSSQDSQQLDVETRFGQLPIFKKPVQLIYSNEQNILTINEDVISQIITIDLPLNIVAICGHYRTGKSYLMNIIASEKTGFSLGRTVKSHTKGIWAWCKPHPKQKDQVLLLLDTEGLSDIEKGDSDHDNKLFCLATLLSSTMIYNHHGVFNQEDLEKLSFITKMTKSIRMAEKKDFTDDENDQILRIVTPSFILCLRDFFLDLNDGDKNITADEYLESALEISTEPGKEKNNSTKECIRKYFPKRKCFTICSPASGKTLSKLEELDKEALAKDFVSDVERLKEFVYECKAKTLDHVTNKLADGLVFDSFARTYVRALSTGDAMTFIKAFKLASVYHNGRLIVCLTNEYKEAVEAIKLPVPKKQELQDKCMALQKQKMSEFRKQCYPQHNEYWENQTMEKMAVVRKERMEENIKKVQAFLANILSNLHDEIVQSKTNYEHRHGSSSYEHDIKAIEKVFEQNTEEYDPDERSAAIIAYRKNIKEEKRCVENAAKLAEEIEKHDKLLRGIQQALTDHYCMQRKVLEQEKEQAVKEERERMERNFNEVMDKQKKKSLFKKFLELFF